MNMRDKMKNIIKFMIGEIPTDILIKRGLKVGKNFNRQQGCFIDPTHCFLITIGDDVTFSIRVCLLAHDASTKKVLGYTKIGQIIIGNNVFIGANTTILPGCTIGDNTIIGANSLITKSFPRGVVVAGNPARVICSVAEFKRKHQLNNKKYFDKSYRFTKQLSEEKKQEMIDATNNEIAYID